MKHLIIFLHYWNKWNKNNLTYLQGNVIKYVTRYKDKNGVEDLQKAKHYIDLLIELEDKDEKKI